MLMRSVIWRQDLFSFIEKNKMVWIIQYKEATDSKNIPLL